MKFTFKLTFVYTNVSESEYILQKKPRKPNLRN